MTADNTKVVSELLSAVTDYFDPVGHGCRAHPNSLRCAGNLLEQYVTRFAGALFDPRMDEPWWDPDRFAPADLMAVATLSMPRFAQPSFLDAVIPIFDADAAASLNCMNSTCKAHIHCLLKQVPAKASIFDGYSAAANLDRMNDIWMLVRADPNLVTTREFGNAGLSKLLARKRPHLVPLMDSVAWQRVRRANDGKKPSCSWCFVRGEYNAANPGLRKHVTTARTTGRVPPWYSDLRVIDIVVWMSDKIGC